VRPGQWHHIGIATVALAESAFQRCARLVNANVEKLSARDIHPRQIKTHDTWHTFLKHDSDNAGNAGAVATLKAPSRVTNNCMSAAIGGAHTTCHDCRGTTIAAM